MTTVIGKGRSNVKEDDYQPGVEKAVTKGSDATKWGDAQGDWGRQRLRLSEHLTESYRKDADRWVFQFSKEELYQISL